MITSIEDIESTLDEFESTATAQETATKATELTTGSSCDIMGSISAFGNKLKASIDTGMLENIKFAMKQGVDLVKDALASIKGKISQLRSFVTNIKNNFFALATEVKASILAFFTNLTSKFVSVMSAISSKLSEISDGFKGLLSGFATSLKFSKFDLCNINTSSVTGAVAGVVNTATDVVNNSVSSLTAAVTDAASSLTNIASTSLPVFDFELPSLV